MSLLSEVLRVLEREKAQTALIGAAALAVRGVSRSTADTDLLCVDNNVLRKEVWAGLEAPGREVRILKGDPEDPLAGSVRIGEGSEIVDVVVGRHSWQREIIDAAELLSLGELRVKVATPAAIVLLKLDAGGPKDAWDIRALLEVSSHPKEVQAEVEAFLPRLSADARRLWARLRSEGS
jgi:hypothetical protein